MPTNEHDIAKALYLAVDTAVAASSEPALPVCPPGRVFTPPNDGKWLEVIHVRNNRENEHWTDERTFQGFLRLILHWPADDQGDLPAMLYLDELATAFAKNTVLTAGAARVKLYDVPLAASKIVDDAKQLFPLTIKYREFSV